MSTSKQDHLFSELMTENVDRVVISNTALDAAVDFIAQNFDPGDIYTTKQLEAWAENNGYVKE